MKEITINTEKIESLVLYSKGLFKKKYILLITTDSKDEHTITYNNKDQAVKNYTRLKDTFNDRVSFGE